MIFLVLFLKRKKTLVLTFSQKHHLSLFLLILWLRQSLGVKVQLKNQLDESLIRPSISPWGILLLFVLKNVGSLQMCIISQQLSKVTIIKKYPIPRIDDLFDQLQRESYFSNIDLWSGYHQFRVKKKDIMKMNFQTQYGRYEFSVMSFVLDE